MSYNFYFADNNRELKQEFNPPFLGGKTHLPNDFGHEFVRFGESTVQALKHDRCQEDIKILLDHYNQHGYGDVIPRLNSFEFRRHVAKFRATLDCWELIPITKVFCKDEIYVRCLTEGHAFTEFVKKVRSTTLRGLTSLSATELEEEYFYPDNYAGYDSIIHERNLIHWDDRDTVDDVKYAFMDAHDHIHDFEPIFDRFLSKLKIDPLEFDLDIDTLGELKNTKMFDPKTRKTALMREFWCDEVDMSAPYLAKRSVVLTEPGSTRDTGVGDASTIAKVKAVNKLCRVILEHCTHSASAPAALSSARHRRVLQKNTYLHLDFKKYGLAFPRALQNAALRAIGEHYSIDIEDLLIHDFYIDIDGEIYRTKRGTMLGWMDCLNELCVHAILEDLVAKDLKIDWIAYNDDVEIGFFTSDERAEVKASMIRELVLAKFSIYDILISISKTYASKASLFLEKYFRFEDKYNLNTEKRQLSSRQYARSLVAKYPWQAKIYFAAAYAIWQNDSISTRCLATCDIEFKEEESFASLFCGGWIPSLDTDIDRSLDNQDIELLELARQLQLIKLPDISSKPTKVSTQEEINRHKMDNIPLAKDPDQGRNKFDMTETALDVNLEAEGAIITYKYRTTNYTGREYHFFATYHGIMSSIEDQSRIFDPG